MTATACVWSATANRVLRRSPTQSPNRTGFERISGLPTNREPGPWKAIQRGLRMQLFIASQLMMSI